VNPDDYRDFLLPVRMPSLVTTTIVTGIREITVPRAVHLHARLYGLPGIVSVGESCLRNPGWYLGGPPFFDPVRVPTQRIDRIRAGQTIAQNEPASLGRGQVHARVKRRTV
jgi:hypothetical protein